MGPAYPACAGTAWDFHRSVWSAIMPRRDHQSPCRSAAPNRRMRCEGKRAVPLPQGFGRLGSVAYRPGRNVTPPELRLPGPSVTVRCRPMLAAYPPGWEVRASVSARGRPRTGRIEWSGCGQTTAPFETEPSTPAAHTKPDAPAREFRWILAGAF